MKLIKFILSIPNFTIILFFICIIEIIKRINLFLMYITTKMIRVSLSPFIPREELLKQYKITTK